MIVIGGMIGVGKTTFTQVIAENLAVEPFYEIYEENPVLQKFYDDPEMYSFMSQIYFAAARFGSIRKASHYPRNVLDRSIQEDMLFAEVNHDLGRISDEEKMVYDSLLKELSDGISVLTKNQQTLLIYLKASFDTVMKRIELRGRTYEQQKELRDYYQMLHTRYDDWMKQYYTPSQILTIDVDKYDIKKEEHKTEIMSLVNMRLQALGL